MQLQKDVWQAKGHIFEHKQLKIAPALQDNVFKLFSQRKPFVNLAYVSDHGSPDIFSETETRDTRRPFHSSDVFCFEPVFYWGAHIKAGVVLYKYEVFPRIRWK